jgi:membrane-associated phospholipid phosphatase
MLGTMADAFANPIMVDALILGREGTVTLPESPTPPQYLYYAPALPTPLDSPPQMERWEPWVRAYTAVGEMLQGISFNAPATTSGTSDRFQVLSSLTGTASLIAELGRPQKSTFEAQIPLVLSWAELRNERATEIVAQIDPQYAFWSSIVYMHPDRTKRTFELVNILLQFCVYVEMRFKHALACWRAVEYNAQVQPMITTPGHGSFPSGHSTQAHAVAHLLTKLLMLDAPNTAGNPKYPTVIDQLRRQAARIATNRVVAGVHFPVDSMAGRMLGVALGEYFVGRCTQTPAQTLMNRTFNAAMIDNNASTDFNPFSADQQLGANKFYSESAGASIVYSPLMGHLWDKARAEWSDYLKFP